MRSINTGTPDHPRSCTRGQSPDWHPGSGSQPGLSLDFGLERLTPEQAHHFYEIVSERYERGATIITSNRHVAEWISHFDDQIIANSALDRLAHNAHQMIIEVESYRKRKGTIGSKL